MRTLRAVRPGRRRWLGLAALLLLPPPALALFLGWGSAPRPWPESTGWTDLSAGDRAAAAPTAAPAGGDGPELAWLGHSGFRLRWGGTTVLLDPHAGDRCAVSPRLLERPFTPADVGPAELVLISHAHRDHLDPETLATLPGVGAVALPEGAERWVPRGFGRRVVGVAPGDRLRAGELELVAVPAAHNGHRHHPLPSPVGALGWIVRRGPDALYYAGDTGASNDFAAIARRHRPRWAVLPIGAYAPAFPLQRYHLAPEQAVAAAEALGVEEVVPCHFATFRLSLDDPAAALPRFAAAARRAGVRWRMPALLGAEAPATAPRAVAGGGATGR